MRVGILGGSFNPPHRGHLALARTVIELGRVEAVVLVPASVPPHKPAPAGAGPADRLEMARLLAGEDGRLSVDDLELRRPGPSYSVDTVRQLVAGHPENRHRLILGSDLARIFASWREFGELLRLAPPLVAERPGTPLAGPPEEVFPGLEAEQAEILLAGRFHMEPLDISSTGVRRLLRSGAGEAELLRCLTRPVLAYIRRRRLYGGDDPSPEDAGDSGT
jgi:nicotinate-nucleotide adenylyltransferase